MSTSEPNGGPPSAETTINGSVESPKPKGFYKDPSDCSDRPGIDLQIGPNVPQKPVAQDWIVPFMSGVALDDMLRGNRLKELIEQCEIALNSGAECGETFAEHLRGHLACLKHLQAAHEMACDEELLRRARAQLEKNP